ncbi:MAG: CehA/McbA family metallohydrolase [Archangium sp.]|nr:CehA/McbA family metallohydrolase [Archangium sp.]
MLRLLAVWLLAAEPTVIEGDVPADGAFFTVPIEVPAGTAELEVRHDDLSGPNILDWGLFAPDGGFLGWGGGNSEPAVINAAASSRSYRPTTLTPGTWKVLVGKALVTQRPARFRLEVEARGEATLAPQPLRRPYVPVAPLEIGARYYAGDLHVHSLESGDARPSLGEITLFAQRRGLDFVALSEHNTLSHLDFFGEAQATTPVLLVPSVEFTTYAGHLNAFGVSRLPPFWLGLDGATFDGAIADFEAQGAVATINHPTLDLGTFCIGCAWQQPLVEGLRAVEVGVGGWDETGSLFDESALLFWEALAGRGVHLAAVGGSDDHRAGRGLNQTQSAIGSPTTLIFAPELSVAALVQGLKEGRTVVKLRGPDDPMIELRELDGIPRAGDTLLGSSARLEATVLGGEGHVLVWIENGVAVREERVGTDPFISSFTLTAPSGKSARVRAELRIAQQPRTVTSLLWLAERADLPPVVAKRPMSCAVTDATPFLLLSLLFRRTRLGGNKGRASVQPERSRGPRANRSEFHPSTPLGMNGPSTAPGMNGP